MRNTLFHIAAAGLMLQLGLASHSAFAQSRPPSTGGASPSGAIQAPPLQPKSNDDQTLPPAVPGAGSQSLNAVPGVVKQQSGDPTTELFTAINGNDYNSAQDAISRGADLNAQNALGETPIDLSVSLNRNNITFMLLASRNDSGGGDDDGSAGPMQAMSGSAYGSATGKSGGNSAAVPVKLIETPSSAPGNNPGAPNLAAGFLGFGK